MKAVLGAVSLLVALAIVGLVAVRQMRAAGRPVAGVASAPIGGDAAMPSRAIERQVRDDVAKALAQGAAARAAASDVP